MEVDVDDNGELLCPACKGSHLIHQRVEVFERIEDAKVGLHVTVSELGLAADTLMEGNPSRRRGGLVVHFRCEVCGAAPMLSVAQHKGCTQFSFG
jgi:hypothetical protein